MAQYGGPGCSPYIQESGGLVPEPRGRPGRYLQRFHRLNRGKDTYKWRVYGRKEEHNGVRLVLSMDCKSVKALESVVWLSFSGFGCAGFSFFGVKPEQPAT
jgi:hypothetical protein